MASKPRLFSLEFPERPAPALADAVVVLGIAGLLYVGVHFARISPRVVPGATISLDPAVLPWYTMLSVGRMAAAYGLSLLFSLTYGYAVARRRSAERVLIPLLDVLQSVPILSFLPVVLLGLSAFLPQRLAANVAAIVLIFTSQAWNLTFSFYQSLTTIPQELREASAILRFDGWTKLKTMELPFAAIGLIWNSMMSWAGGWFFLMAAESFTIGARDFRLPGLGSYLAEAARRGDLTAIAAGLAALVLTIVLLDQLAWRPLLAWADKFKVEAVEGDEPARSWFYNIVSASRLVALMRRLWRPFSDWIDGWARRRTQVRPPQAPTGLSRRSLPGIVAALAAAIALGYLAVRAVGLLAGLPAVEWAAVGLGLLATAARVAIALMLAVAWTVPAAVAIGATRQRAAAWQPIVQVVASIPATALFPVILLVLLRATGGLNFAAILLMLMGTQWYLLFNAIAGVAATPQDLKDTTSMLRLGRLDRWRSFLLPALFPFLVTGAIAASGGAWNASIVAEYVTFGSQTYSAVGVGAVISQATASGNYPLLLAATLALVATVVLVNRLVWRRLYRLAEDRYRME